MHWVWRAICILACLAIPLTAEAQSATQWHPPKNASTMPAATQICGTSKYDCLQLLCIDGTLSFNLKSGKGALNDVGQKATLAVDGQAVAVLNWQERGVAFVPYNAALHGTLLQRLRSGSRASVHSTKGSFAVTLRGAQSEINRVIVQCNRLASALTQGVDTFSGRFQRLRNEASHDPSSAKVTLKINKLKGYDLSGNDIRSGLTDPLLNAISLNQCETLCTATPNCNAYTHNDNTDTCFLKSGAQAKTPFRGATSGVLSGTVQRFAAPPTRGPGTVVDAGLTWQNNDTVAGWQARLRASSARLGGNCQAEKAAVLQAISGMKIAMTGSPAQVGRTLEVTYQNMALQDRIPAWIILAADQPMRFGGRGFFALGPEAPNPFGLSYGQGQHRALVALASRGAGQNGQIALKPMQAGPVRVTAQVAGYLRACQQEFTFDLGTIPIQVAPAQPRIVLSNPAGRAAYSHLVHIEKFNRVVMLNNTRFLLLNEADGTELAEMSGEEFHVSPTQRFIAVLTGDHWKLIDVIDGTQVTRLRSGELGSGQLMWGAGDSFALATNSPWGEVNIASTFSDTLKLDRIATGPSCCPAEPSKTRLGIDLENATVSIWGMFGYYIAALQNPEFANTEGNTSAYGSSRTGHLSLYLHALNMMGSVSPVSIAERGQIVGGWTYSTKGSDKFAGTTQVRTRVPSDVTRQKRLNRVGLTPEPLRLSGQITPPDFAKHLPRTGLQLSEMRSGSWVGGLRLPKNVTGQKQALRQHLEGTSRKDVANQVMEQLKFEAHSHGWPLDWTETAETAEQRECYHLSLGQKDSMGQQPLKGAFVPKTHAVSISRIQMGRAAIWAVWHSCEAGATYGSLRGQSLLAIYDFGRPFSGDIQQVQASENGFMVNNRVNKHFEYPSVFKADDRHILMYAPGAGTISLYDRVSRDWRYIGENLPNGDLLAQAFLTQDKEYVVQANADGAFYVHRMATGQTVLSGRIAQDEVVVWNEAFEYDATAEAASLIDLRFPGAMGQYSLDRFGPALRHKHLARDTLYAGRQPQPADLSVPPGLTGRITAEGATANLSLQFAADRVTQLTVFQDGTITDQISVPAGQDEIQTSVPRLAQTRWVTVIATDAQGYASLPVTADLGPSPNATAQARAMIVGINTYRDAKLPSLNYALRDGGRFAEALLSLPHSPLPEDAIRMLKDRRATPEKILSALDATLDGLEKGDHAVLYFAGHGLRDTDGTFYFGTSGTDLQNLPTTALRFDQVAQRLAQSPARLTIILDACHSGAAGTGSFATNDDVVGNLAGLSSNVTVLSASKGREISRENAAAGGGVFTQALVNVLTTSRTRYDRNTNGRIEASELYEGVKSQVVNSQNGAQTPWMVKVRLVGDYAVF